jgi:hypothetical protein
MGSPIWSSSKENQRECSSHKSNAAKVSILLTKNYYFHIYWFAKYILFYKTRTNCMLIIIVLDELSTFEYIENMMMF